MNKLLLSPIVVFSLLVSSSVASAGWIPPRQTRSSIADSMESVQASPRLSLMQAPVEHEPDLPEWESTSTSSDCMTLSQSDGGGQFHLDVVSALSLDQLPTTRLHVGREICDCEDPPNQIMTVPIRQPGERFITWLTSHN